MRIARRVPRTMLATRAFPELEWEADVGGGDGVVVEVDTLGTTEDMEDASAVGAGAGVWADDVAMVRGDDAVMDDVDDDSASAFHVSAFGWVGLYSMLNITPVASW